MDVRCPNCRTEYELDETRLKPAGATVKCASCEHVFRVRRRASTNFGVGVGSSATQPELEPVLQERRPERDSGGVAPTDSAQAATQSWLIRLPDGEIKVCQEFATLQRWIVSGSVTDDCEISRTGKQWKPLSALKELSSFFAIAREARTTKARAGSSTPPRSASASAHPNSAHPNSAHPNSAHPNSAHPNTLSRPVAAAKPGIEPAFSADPTEPVNIGAATSGYDETEEDTIEMSREESAAAIRVGQQQLQQRDAETPSVDLITPSRLSAASVPPAIPAGTRTRDKSIPPPAPGSRARRESELRLQAASVPPPIPKKGSSAHSTASGNGGGKAQEWSAGSAGPRLEDNRVGPSGPTGGLAKSVPVTDAAFASSNLAPSRVKSDEFKDGRFVATDHAEEPLGVGDDDDWEEELYRAGKGGAGKWIVLLSVALLAAAAAAMYFVVFKESKKEVSEASASDSSNSGGTPTVQPAPSDAADSAGNDSAEASSDDPKEFFAVLDGALLRFERSGVERLQTELEALPEGFERAVYSARLHNALAQHELDDSQLQAQHRSSTSPKPSKNVRKEALLGSSFADAALALQKDSPLANAVKADALRLAKSPSREVERWLRKSKNNSESKYVSAMLRTRDKRFRDAQVLLEEIRAAGSSPRATYRLAAIAFREGKFKEAQELLQEILALDSEHEGATSLAALIEEALRLGNNPGGSGPSEATPKSGTGGTARRPADNYDSLLARADTAAETGNCRAAVKSYEKALDENPSGVSALTGLGYCNLDAKNYASAQARFRAALGISPRYQDALWGVAEGYQQQGLKAQAIKGYRKFIEEHPASRRSEMAKRQIDRLGGSVFEAPKSAPAPALPPDSVPSPEPATKPKPAVDDSVPSPEPAAKPKPNAADSVPSPSPEPAAKSKPKPKSTAANSVPSPEPAAKSKPKSTAADSVPSPEPAAKSKPKSTAADSVPSPDPLDAPGR